MDKNNKMTKVFVDGLRAYHNERDFIIADMYIDADAMIKFINSNKDNVNQKGHIPIQLKKSEKGMYAELNSWVIKNSKQVTTAQHSPDREDDLPF